MAERVAVVLFNLGGPDSPAAIKPFLKNLFTDKNILRVPFFIRPFLARLIAARRVKPASENYALLGGKSPLLELTQQQALAIEGELPGVKCFIAMRYWHPMSVETARAVKAWQPDRVILFPLYPQYSTTTSKSSLEAWQEAACRVGLAAPTRFIGCWADDEAYLSATAVMVREKIEQAQREFSGQKLRVLFSAHGLPEVIVKRGDPYQWQIEQTAAGVVRHLNIEALDWQVCYQSRATPQKWLEPSIEQALDRAAEDQAGVVVVPIAFVSDHSETLVELDHEYALLAAQKKVPFFVRVAAQNSDPGFIGAVAGMIKRAIAGETRLRRLDGERWCPRAFGDCGCQ